MSTGLGVNIRSLFGEKADLAPYLYQVILSVSMTEEHIDLRLSGNKTIRLVDNGQSCCASRYMRTDDDIQALVGSTLERLEIKDGPDLLDGIECHEQQFLEIGTNRGFITIANHNEHNGYYGGFSLTIEELKTGEKE